MMEFDLTLPIVLGTICLIAGIRALFRRRRSKPATVIQSVLGMSRVDNSRFQ